MKYFIVTFGCAANEADSERVAAAYEARGFMPAKTIQEADEVIINTCMIREKAENRVYGLIHNLEKLNGGNGDERKIREDVESAKKKNSGC